MPHKHTGSTESASLKANERSQNKTTETKKGARVADTLPELEVGGNAEM
jgi:hypothetical protein